MDSSSISSSRPRFQSRRGVRVVGKIRPLHDSEVGDLSRGDPSCSPNRPQVSVARCEGEHAVISFKDQPSGRKDSYKLDWCYEPEEGVGEIFSREVKPLIQGLFQGSNSCVIAYGARGSGKTQILQGSEENPGLAPITLYEILAMAKEIEGLVTISCYEVFQDHIYDILEPKEQEVLVLEDAGRRIQLKGLSQVPVKSMSEFNSLYFHGCNQWKQSQKIGSEDAIRSHRGLIIYVSRVVKESNHSLVGKINLVDLADYDDTKSRDNGSLNLSVGAKVNKSLYALMNVVFALNSSETYVAYRQSKLTRLLQDFMCKSSGAVLVTCLNPTACQDTIHALSLASRSCQAANVNCTSSAKNSNTIPRFIPPSSPFKGAIRTLDGSVLKDEPSKSAKNEKRGNGTPFVPKTLLHKQSSSTKRPGFSFKNLPEEKSNDTISILSGRKLFSANVNSIEDSTSSSAATAVDTTTNEDINLRQCKQIETSITDEETLASIADDVVSPALAEVNVCVSDEYTDLQDTQTDAKPAISEHDNSVEVKTPMRAHQTSPKLSEKLREISNSLKLLSTQPINIGTPKADVSCIRKEIMDSIDPKTPGEPLNWRLDNRPTFDPADTPQDILRTRSTGLKKSLVQECLAFLNSANKEELKGLKGIGEKRATYILNLREKSPEPFKNLDDVKDLGLSSKQINKMMSKILEEF
ncbi:kinesin-like protein KIN-10C isoform X2 [Ananas comosus]|uniref:Kinesin-like protein KIN-10C isoform X2 n=1 Tax=Ananas comosus TaxID=4615 RepID=A0A6P5F648_ANACO|nr:kinesin-like protein KIN-10C isoform X2 [Ananas comosus]